MTGLREAFGGIRRALDAARVPYAVAGSWASTVHGEPRQTNDIDLVATFDERSLDQFLNALGPDYYRDEDTARESLRLGRPFNVIHKQWAFKFDFFPVHDDHGASELVRRLPMSVAALDDQPVPVVTAEDIVIAKLRWYRAGGEVSQQQWRDILGVLRLEGPRLDGAYLEAWTLRLGLDRLYRRARHEAAED